jgi:hypothetical protein
MGRTFSAHSDPSRGTRILFNPTRCPPLLSFSPKQKILVTSLTVNQLKIGSLKGRSPKMILAFVLERRM